MLFFVFDQFYKASFFVMEFLNALAEELFSCFIDHGQALGIGVVDQLITFCLPSPLK